MIPIRDDQPRFSTPYVTYFLIGLNLLIFVFEATLTPESFKSDALPVWNGSRQHHRVPGRATRIGFVGSFPPLLTSMFLHGSWMHVIGNMWFLWIFGDNIEDYLGHFKYLLFYLLSGLAAAFSAAAPELRTRDVPTVGASGAIAGVLGAYFILYPGREVLTWFPILFLFYLPAWVMLGYWFAMQFLSGAATSMALTAKIAVGLRSGRTWGDLSLGIVLIKVFPERSKAISLRNLVRRTSDVELGPQRPEISPWIQTAWPEISEPPREVLG